MNKVVVDFYFDFMSPYCYLAALRLQEMSNRYDVETRWLPVNLPKLIALSGNTPPLSIKNKAMYSLRDLNRWVKHMDVPFKMILPGSFDSRPAMRIALGLHGDERIHYAGAVFSSIWSGRIDPRQAGWLEQVIALHGLPEVYLRDEHDGLDDMTLQAFKAGAFGVPTFFLRQSPALRAEMFFGLDHMDFLERALERANA